MSKNHLAVKINGIYWELDDPNLESLGGELFDIIKNVSGEKSIVIEVNTFSHHDIQSPFSLFKEIDPKAKLEWPYPEIKWQKDTDINGEKIIGWPFEIIVFPVARGVQLYERANKDILVTTSCVNPKTMETFCVFKNPRTNESYGFPNTQVRLIYSEETLDEIKGLKNVNSSD